MKDAERAILLETTVFQFLTENEGSYIVSIRQGVARIQAGGMTRDQVNLHKKLIRWTLGLWLPVYLTVYVLRNPEIIEISFTDNGNALFRRTR